MTELNEAYAQEEARLQVMLKKIEKQLVELEGIPRYRGKDLVEQALDHQRQNRLKQLRIARNEPYFGRLDFAEDGKEEPTPLYIGKFGVQDDKENEPLVIDWRAPVASLFYSFTGETDRAEYTSPDGVIEGTVYLKRNIAIRKQQIQRVVDSYVRGEKSSGMVDEFLLYRLGEKKDNRLRDIVSTIQHEQDQIIRAERNLPLVIQGVPGSGKTTVALHRLAYLLYQYQEQLRAERFVIFAPNRMFVDYISDVLPELGVGDVQQFTFADWAYDFFDDELPPPEEKEWADEFMMGGNVDQAELAWFRYKGSLAFYDRVAASLTELEATFVPEKPFSPWEGKGLPAEEIRRWFAEEYRHYPLLKRKERVFARLKRWLEMELKEIRDIDPRGKIRKQANQRLRTYMKAWPQPTPWSWYQHLISTKSSEFEVAPPAAFVQKVKRKQVGVTDLAPLLHIHVALHGISNEKTFDHVVIDEAQDVSPYQLAVLQRFCQSNSFTILGDLLQNIHVHKGITEWRELMDLFAKGTCRYVQLNKSYRSTMEIIQFANEIVRDYAKGVAVATPVYRSGDPVRMLSVSATERSVLLAQEVQALIERGVGTVAVVTRTEAESERVAAELREQGVEVHLITSTQAEYHGGISVIPIYLTKGMEFDAVILVEVDEGRYPVDELHAKLLFVGCTRALHHLVIMSSERPSPLLEKAARHGLGESGGEEV
ncbi:HelD family protein [Laceyella sacchari]|uniref:DNA 3'-5' helicase n=1 Tax=Laceyella sacchari TaxID=37482 RepID=A0ABY5U0S1_LACSH|nr:3'-5' exonuclease [Laceyella sacchari]UWE03261.1 AAA family ATPase [Laceyella sacchari]